jgi:hypothetical protein
VAKQATSCGRSVIAARPFAAPEFVTSPGNGREVMSSGWAAVETAGADPTAPAPRLYIWPHQSKTCKQQRPPMQVVLPQPNPQHYFVRALGKHRVTARRPDARWGRGWRAQSAPAKP